MKFVKVARVGGKVLEVVLNDSCTAQDALIAAELCPHSKETVFVDHVEIKCDLNEVCLKSGASVIIEPSKVVPVSSTIKELIDAIADLSKSELYIDDYIQYDDEDEEEGIDYASFYENGKSLIDNIIKISKRA